MPTRKQQYSRQLREIARRFDRLERTTIERSVALLVTLRNQLQLELTTAEGFNEFRIRELTANVDRLVDRYERQLRSVTTQAQLQAARLGAASVVEPLAAAGLTSGFFQPTPAQINTLLDFSADLIRNVGAQTRNAINTEIRMAALGGRSTIEAMRRITDKLGGQAGRARVTQGVSARAETILRTEMGRVFNVSNHAQQQATARQVPELQKMWIATGDGRTRIEHLVAHGQLRRVDEPFTVGGVSMMFPLDPSAPPHLTIRCRCRTVTVHPELGPVGGPLDARIAKELKRRRT